MFFAIVGASRSSRGRTFRLLLVVMFRIGTVGFGETLTFLMGSGTVGNVFLGFGAFAQFDELVDVFG